MNENFIKGFTKVAKKFKASDLVYRLLRNLPIRLKGHSTKGLKNTRAGRSL